MANWFTRWFNPKHTFQAVVKQLHDGLVDGTIILRQPPIPPPQRETLLWRHEAPPSPGLIGTPVELDGRRGRVVAVSLLTVTVEWDK